MMQSNINSVIYNSVLAAIVLCFSSFTNAAIENAGNLDPAVQQLMGGGGVEQQIQQNVDWKSGSYGQSGLQDISDLDDIRPFGSQLFDGGFSGLRSDGLNSDYKVTPGDQVVLRIWGAIEMERVIPVDARGNVFIPTIGPVRVQGLSHKDLDTRIRGSVRSIYPENVHVYTQVQGVQPVGVFVTGFVPRPGRYAGTPNDSLIYFLNQAGGVDDQMGSYRAIKVIRNGQIIQIVDLYAFLLNGQMARPQFRDGDTLVVGGREASVIVSGDIERSYRYELTKNEMIGRALIKLVHMKAGVSHVLLRGSRHNGPLTGYFPLQEFSTQSLRNGDEVILSADKRHDTIVVEVEGSFFGPSRYSLPRDIMLHDFLDSIAVPESITDITSISMRRTSIAIRQKASLNESLKRLEATYLGASSSTSQEASIRVQEAELISQFIAKASLEEPNGRLVVASNDHIANIRLQDGDVITIPEQSDSLLISGEVLVPQSVVFQSGKSVRYYIDGAGGFSSHADESKILIVRQNGEVRDAGNIELKAGDEILVLPEVPTKNLQLATSISQILYQIAVATKVVTGL
ncbi:polysaccharide biosynthesis/export family protein [Amphritea japonica]|uniref:Polysaccharide export protein n=1 Tax=Amphritea japonica ATCC BAA-1530 TaxID=1278309 RepID=A0A7R6P3B4_9GAMM|nr:polysaccharide biosynthesis/export family protein [Amphritea japonica]BBB25104.1 polysaccharide export protein [Amphritea japonica ATCC BAA-1530]